MDAWKDLVCSMHFNDEDFTRLMNSGLKLKRELKQDDIGVCVYPSKHTDDFLSVANGLYGRSSECIDTRVPESTSQTMSRGPIMSQSTSAFLSAGRIDRNKIGFKRFVKFIKNSRSMQIENFFRGSSSGDV